MLITRAAAYVTMDQEGRHAYSQCQSGQTARRRARGMVCATMVDASVRRAMVETTAVLSVLEDAVDTARATRRARACVKRADGAHGARLSRRV